jgi:hypothetical protein
MSVVLDAHDSCQFPHFRRAFFSAAAWSSDTVGGMDGGGPSPAVHHHLQRPNLKTLDLKALPREDVSSPSETQIRRAKYLFFEKQCSQVAEGIFLAGDAVAKQREVLRQNGVTHVVNCVGMLCKEYFKGDGIQYRTYYLQGAPQYECMGVSLPPWLPACFSIE